MERVSDSDLSPRLVTAIAAIVLAAVFFVYKTVQAGPSSFAGEVAIVVMLALIAGFFCAGGSAWYMDWTPFKRTFLRVVALSICVMVVTGAIPAFTGTTVNTLVLESTLYRVFYAASAAVFYIGTIYSIAGVVRYLTGRTKDQRNSSPEEDILGDDLDLYEE